MISRRILIAGAFAGTALVAGGAIAQNQATVGIQTVTTYSADARITAVDPSTRTVSLAFTNGATATRTVSPAVADFSARKVGDNVSVGFEDKLTFVLSGPNIATPRERDTSVTASHRPPVRVPPASQPAEAIANWWVTAVNPRPARSRWSILPAAQMRTYNVTTAEGREQLPRVKLGDSLTAINTRWRSSRSRPRRKAPYGKNSVRGAESGSRAEGDAAGGLSAEEASRASFCPRPKRCSAGCASRRQCLAFGSGEIARLRVVCATFCQAAIISRVRGPKAPSVPRRVEAQRGECDLDALRSAVAR